jgi:hypothetical protein
MRILLTAIGFLLALAVAQPASAQGLDRTAGTNYGTTALAPNWRPNPFQVTMVAGGDQQVSNSVSGCVGWITGQPDFRLTFNASGDVRPFDITATSSGDTTLIVQGPDLQFICNDDTDGANPRVTISNPQSGDYAIWVGSYADEDVDAVLSFTERR